MEFISWNEGLSVGVKKFDEEHQELVGYVNRLNDALKLGGAQKAMIDILRGLVRYTDIHFKHEEYYMQLHDYPAFIIHKKEHDELRDQVQDFIDRLNTGTAVFSLELMSFLKDWLTNHIKGSDMAYKAFFNSKGVF